MISNNSASKPTRIVVEVIAGIPEYLVQTKERILFFDFWLTVRERKTLIGKKLRFENLEKAKAYIKG